MSKSDNVVLVNQDKKRRAEDIYSVLTGKRPAEAMSAEHKAYLVERVGGLLSESGVELKDHDAAVVGIYQILGGAVITREEQAKQVAKKVSKKSFARTAKEHKDEKDEDDVPGKDEDNDDDE